jgi:2-polyprenyl-3-methyl-5-hydroxy-6-metoxy-1,4-benzoquinol methylase
LINQSIEDHASTNAEKYDVVASFQVIEHVDDPLISLKIN